MKKLITLIIVVFAGHMFAQDTSQLDEKIVAMLTKEADAVIRCHKDSNGDVGMSPNMAKRYGLPADQLLFWLDLKETIVGTKITDKKVKMNAGRSDGPVFLAEGDYLVFVKKSDQEISDWTLVADHFGIQPYTPKLAELVKSSFTK